MLGLNSSGYTIGSLLPTLAVSGVIEHIELDKGLDMVDKAGAGVKKRTKNTNKSEMTWQWNKQKQQTNNNKRICHIENDPWKITDLTALMMIFYVRN